MPNIIDYLKWRGDLTFKQDNINEVDAIILARFSYLPFKEINFAKKHTISEISNKMQDLNLDKFIWEDDKEFIIKLGNTRRYKDLIITDYKEILDIEAEKQFAAITIWLPNKYKYVSFRGTDMSLVGWKEDFNMSFMKDIPSQKEAVKYLNEIGKKYREKLIIGGHSKGGNLAIYSSMFCENKIKKKIAEIINADGPGFDKSVILSENYKQMLDKIDTYIPQSSIIGRLLEHEDDYCVVKSNQRGIMQHDIYSWEVEGNRLVRISNLTNESDMLNKAVKNWLENTTQDQRKNFINIIYEVIKTSEAENISDFGIDTPQKITRILKSYKNIDKDGRKEIETMIKLLFESIINELKEIKKEDVG